MRCEYVLYNYGSSEHKIFFVKNFLTCYKDPFDNLWAYLSQEEKLFVKLLQNNSIFHPLQRLLLTPGPGPWTQTLYSYPEKPGPWKTWILKKVWTQKNLDPKKSLDPKKPGPWKTWEIAGCGKMIRRPHIIIH